MTKTSTLAAATRTRATAGDAAIAPEGFRLLRSTPACVRDRGVVRLGGMSPFAARAKAPSGVAGRAKARG